MPAFQQTNEDVDEFINNIEDPVKREDSKTLNKFYKEITGEKPVMWSGIVGYGKFKYKYASGHEGECFIGGFSPRKAALTFYFMDQVDTYNDELAKIGKHTKSKGCLYVKKLEDIDMNVLKKIIKASYENVPKFYQRA